MIPLPAERTGFYRADMARPSGAAAEHLAKNLRHLRERRALTQQRLARISGIPRSTLALLESGSGNPTLSVLSELAAALKLSIEELLSKPHSQAQLFKNGTLSIDQRGKGRKAEVRKLLPDPIPGMEIFRLELAPGARLTGNPHRLGTREYLACERGRITLWAAGERYDLSFGDVVAYQGDQAHSYWNDGNAIAVGYSVVAIAPAGVLRDV